MIGYGSLFLVFFGVRIFYMGDVFLLIIYINDFINCELYNRLFFLVGFF